MAYSLGGIIQASDINAWLNTVNTLYGVGNGTRGYGQTSLQNGVAAGSTITSSHWQNLRTMLSTIATHQGTSASTPLVPANLLNPAQVITAHTGANPYDIGALVAAVDVNRLTGTSAMSLVSGAYTLTKAASWAATTTCSFDVVFTSEDHARYFFNTGGQLRVRLTATGTLLSSSAQQDVDWRTVFASKVGTLQLGAAFTNKSGSAGSIFAGGNGTQGFYGLALASTNIYNGTNIGGTGYTANDVLIGAAVRSVAGVNGGNGTTVRFTVQVNDDHTNPAYDSVSAGMAVAVDIYRVSTTNLTTAIAAPTITTVTAWS